MFELYTEKARRGDFLCAVRSEQFGSPYIETEHLLLGLLREDKALTNRFLRSAGPLDSIRKQIEVQTPIREKVSTSVDLRCRTMQAGAGVCGGEAGRFRINILGRSILLLGLLREEIFLAAEDSAARGLRCRDFARSCRNGTRENEAAAGEFSRGTETAAHH